MRAIVLAALASVLTCGACACEGCRGSAPAGSLGAAAPSAASSGVCDGGSVTDCAPAARAAGAAEGAARRSAAWTAAAAAAKEGEVEDLAALARIEQASGLVEASSDPERRPTALRAMAFAEGWAQLPLLARISAGTSDDDARIALDAVVALAARPRRAVDEENVDELREGCDGLLALAKDGTRARERRVLAIGALRMMPCPPSHRAELPTDLDAR